jgi:uncharacterized phiE125 gp8 family phage protein
MAVTSAADLVTLADAKAWLNIDEGDDSKDSVIARSISAASLAVANYVGCDLSSASRNEVRDGDGRTIFYTKSWPITAVSSVNVDGVSIPASASIAHTGYSFDDMRIVLRGWHFAPGRLNVVVSYTSGYATIPPQITQAVLLATAGMYHAQSVDPNVTSESVPGVYSASYAQGAAAGAQGSVAGTLPVSAKAMLEPYRRMFMP